MHKFVNMKLKPINKDIPAIGWECSCRGVSLIQRDAVFESSRQEIQELYDLHEFSFDRENRNWTILSAEWISPDQSRINATRRKLSTGQREPPSFISNLGNIVVSARP